MILTEAGTSPLRVGLLGWGAIGRGVAEQIEASTRAGDRSVVLSAVASRFSDGSTHPLAVAAEEIGTSCDVVVEAAGPDALRVHGERCLTAGADLLVVSIGALMDTRLLEQLISAGPGRPHLCSGAIGGLDLLAAARNYGPIQRIVLETTKPGATLVRDWMSDDLRRDLLYPSPGSNSVECFRGTVADAVQRFPESLNVSAALALAAGDDSVVEVAVIGSSTATTNTHDITIDSAAGQYRFSISNRPSPTNPRSSHITAWAVVRSLRSLAGCERMAFR